MTEDPTLRINGFAIRPTGPQSLTTNPTYRELIGNNAGGRTPCAAECPAIVRFATSNFQSNRMVRITLPVFASVLLYCGLGMLLLVPHAPGESYWAAERLTYGLIPLLVGCIMATICGRMAVQRPDADTLIRSLQRHWLYSFCGVPVVFLFLCANDLWLHNPLPKVP